MQTLPFAISELLTVIVRHPFSVVSTVLFAIALHKLANHYHCYGLPKNLLFGIVSGAVAFAFLYLYAFLSRNYGLRSLITVEIIVGYMTAVLVTVIRRLVFSQRPPRPLPPVEEGTA